MPGKPASSTASRPLTSMPELERIRGREPEHLARAQRRLQRPALLREVAGAIGGHPAGGGGTLRSSRRQQRADGPTAPSFPRRGGCARRRGWVSRRPRDRRAGPTSPRAPTCVPELRALRATARTGARTGRRSAVRARTHRRRPPRPEGRSAGWPCWPGRPRWPMPARRSGGRRSGHRPAAAAAAPARHANRKHRGSGDIRRSRRTRDRAERLPSGRAAARSRPRACPDCSAHRSRGRVPSRVRREACRRRRPRPARR